MPLRAPSVISCGLPRDCLTLSSKVECPVQNLSISSEFASVYVVRAVFAKPKGSMVGVGVFFGTCLRLARPSFEPKQRLPLDGCGANEGLRETLWFRGSA